MSRVELNTPLVRHLDSFITKQKAYLRPERKKGDLFKPSKEPIQLTPDEEEMYMMFVEDAVLFELCK